MEVMGLMLGEFVDDYTVRVIDVFAMPQTGTVSIFKYFSRFRRCQNLSLRDNSVEFTKFFFKMYLFQNLIEISGYNFFFLQVLEFSLFFHAEHLDR